MDCLFLIIQPNDRLCKKHPQICTAFSKTKIPKRESETIIPPECLNFSCHPPFSSLRKTEDRNFSKAEVGEAVL